MLCCIRGSRGGRGSPVLELELGSSGLRQLPPSVPLAGRTLERLRASRNRLQQLPPALFLCRELKLLHLGDNEISSIPAAISSLSALRDLDLAGNTLIDLPDSIKCLKQLERLDLSGNPFEKPPEPLTGLVSLRELYLNDVGLEYLPGNFGRLSNLRILEVRDNCLMILPKSLARLTGLIRLDIGQNEFSEFPEVIGKFSHLKELWIDCNTFSNISPGIGNLVELIHFEASDNAISELPEEIGSCVALIDLCLSSNSLVAIPDTIGNLTFLVSLKLDSNSIDSLPSSIGNLINLEELILTSNHLLELPSTVGHLRKLQCLNVDQNFLRTIPSEIGGCVSLTVLSCRSNSLTQIPDEIGHLSLLKVLNLVKNSLHWLPCSLLNCNNLIALWLSENQSKPLVPMQSEVDARTGRQVLTCILFPQISTSLELTGDKALVTDIPVSARHISFVDVKTAAKSITDKPGQLRRAPTPYPKELRALAKHARNIQKDANDDSSLSMQNAIHIKAAKVTPTLRQRFASNHSIGSIRSVSESGYSGKNENLYFENVSTCESASENPYDKLINLECQKSYQNLDRTLYSESADSAYGGYNEQFDRKSDSSPYEVMAGRNPCDSIEERVNDIISQSSHELYASTKRISEKSASPSSVLYDSCVSGNRNSITNNVNHNYSLYQKSREPSINEYSSIGNSHNTVSPYCNNNESFYEQNYSQNHIMTGNGITYDTIDKKMYGRQIDNLNNCYGNYSSEMYSSKLEMNHNLNHPCTMNVTNNSNLRCVSRESPLNMQQRNAIYNYHNSTNDEFAYETTSMSSHRSHNDHSGISPGYIYKDESIINSVNPSDLGVPLEMSVLSQSKLTPPPYHIAATYSKQAQYFNNN